MQNCGKFPFSLKVANEWQDISDPPPTLLVVAVAAAIVAVAVSGLVANAQKTGEWQN